MSDPTDPVAWVARAEEDYLVMRLSLAHDPPLTYSACFHAQQSAEKYLKAILVARGQVFPKTHDLRQLLNLCERGGIDFPVELDRADTLSFYAVRTRYPGDDPMLEEAEEAEATASYIRRIARSLLDLPNRDEERE